MPGMDWRRLKKLRLVFFGFFWFKHVSLRLDGDTAAEKNGSRAKTGRDWTRQFNDQEWQNDICLVQCLAGGAILRF